MPTALLSGEHAPSPDAPQSQLPWQGTGMLGCRESVDEFSFARPVYLWLTLAAGLTRSEKQQGPSNETMNCKGSHGCPSGNELGSSLCSASMCPRRGAMLLARARGLLLAGVTQGYHSSAWLVWEFLTGSRKPPV